MRFANYPVSRGDGMPPPLGDAKRAARAASSAAGEWVIEVLAAAFVCSRPSTPLLTSPLKGGRDRNGGRRDTRGEDLAHSAVAQNAVVADAPRNPTPISLLQERLRDFAAGADLVADFGQRGALSFGQQRAGLGDHLVVDAAQ